MPAAGVDDRWLVSFGPSRPGADLRLFCLSYAGGSAESFRGWADRVDERVEVLALQLPGHGRRLREPLIDSWPTLVTNTFTALRPYLDVPHAFYGHSFGGRLAYELTRRCERHCPGLTERLFVSGCRSPGWPQRRPFLHELADVAFTSALDELGGTPKEVLDSPELMQMMLPVIRAEIRLAELWQDFHGTASTVPISAVYGRSDPIDDAAATAGWVDSGGPGSEVLQLPGGHFHLHSHLPALLDVVNSRLSRVP